MNYLGEIIHRYSPTFAAFASSLRETFRVSIAATPRSAKNIRVKLHPPGIVTSQERFGNQISFL